MTTTTLKITDTGKRRTSSGSVEETDRANNGTTITLNGVELTFDGSALLNTQPALGKFTTSSDAGSKWAGGEVDTIGIEKPKWTARGLLDQDVSADLQLIKPLMDLRCTKGYKTLGGDLPDWADGASNSSTVSVHVKNVKMRHLSNSNLIEYDIEMFQTE